MLASGELALEPKPSVLEWLADQWERKERNQERGRDDQRKGTSWVRLTVPFPRVPLLPFQSEVTTSLFFFFFNTSWC
jgi:hypothetical protein